MLREYHLHKEVSIDIGDPGDQSKTSLRRLIILPPVIDSECAAMVAESGDVPQENSPALPFTLGIRERCSSLDGAPVHMCTRKLQAATGKRSSMQWAG